MSMITTFTHVSLDGFFAGPKGEIDWFHAIEHDPDYDAYTHAQSSSGDTLLFGHTTYDMMKAFWPTPEAETTDPQMAKVMRNSPKVVVSKKLKSVSDEPNRTNVRVIHEIDREEILDVKGQTGITILGSGTIVQQLSNLGLLDEYRLIVVPVILGAGKPLFQDVQKRDLELQEARQFRNGIAAFDTEAADVVRFAAWQSCLARLPRWHCWWSRRSGRRS
jgi:dihydrofolate reductase